MNYDQDEMSAFIRSQRTIPKDFKRHVGAIRKTERLIEGSQEFLESARERGMI